MGTDALDKMNLLEIFQDTKDHVEFPAGTVLFKEGDLGDYMYVVIEGEVELSLHGVPIYTAIAGDIVGEMALLDSHERSATASAKTDCHLAPIDVHWFKLLTKHTPDFALHVMNILADRLRLANESVVVDSMSRTKKEGQD
jgi:CRP-like cAMP-binding protein